MTKPKARISTKAQMRAISLLSEWTRDQIAVEYVELVTGLHYSGVLVPVTRDQESKQVRSLHFVGRCGLSTPISPFGRSGWAEVKVSKLAGREAVIAKERGGRRYKVSPEILPTDEIGKVRDQLRKWNAQQTAVDVTITNSGYSVVFAGKVGSVVDGGFWLEHRSQGVVVAFDGFISNIGGESVSEVKLVHHSTGTAVHISEKTGRSTNIFARFRFVTSAVQ